MTGSRWASVTFTIALHWCSFYWGRGMMKENQCWPVQGERGGRIRHLRHRAASPQLRNTALSWRTAWLEFTVGVCVRACAMHPDTSHPYWCHWAEISIPHSQISTNLEEENGLNFKISLRVLGHELVSQNLLEWNCTYLSKMNDSLILLTAGSGKLGRHSGLYKWKWG